MKDGEVVCKKAFGMVDLEYDVPIGFDTVFEVTYTLVAIDGSIVVSGIALYDMQRLHAGNDFFICSEPAGNSPTMHVKFAARDRRT